jgi:hypothetical protein
VNLTRYHGVFAPTQSPADTGARAQNPPGAAAYRADSLAAASAMSFPW